MEGRYTNEYSSSLLMAESVSRSSIDLIAHDSHQYRIMAYQWRGMDCTGRIGLGGGSPSCHQLAQSQLYDVWKRQGIVNAKIYGYQESPF